ncbi:jg27751 [Pararge aegeria aegeria]|uniref:Jg27751 protein n=1 Tax=Pararge aegeria aegeria TaxID=348720 RepID=A0A8S4QWC6_9NEOP|nr:jg27751 [Pararge aegeria aegeria]
MWNHAASGGIDHDVKARICAAWAKWREFTVRPNNAVKAQAARLQVHLASTDTWPTLTRHVQELRVTEMKMLRWMSKVTSVTDASTLQSPELKLVATQESAG